MNLHVTGPSQFADYLEGFRYMTRVRRLALRGGILAISLAVLLWPSNEFAFVGVFLAFYAIFLSDFLFTYRLRRFWEQSPEWQQPIDMHINDEGMRQSDQQGQQELIRWEDFTCLKESRNLFLLLLGPKAWIAVPKRLLNADKEEQVRSFVLKKLSDQTEQLCSS